MLRLEKHEVMLCIDSCHCYRSGSCLYATACGWVHSTSFQLLWPWPDSPGTSLSQWWTPSSMWLPTFPGKSRGWTSCSRSSSPLCSKASRGRRPARGGMLWPWRFSVWVAFASCWMHKAFSFFRSLLRAHSVLGFCFLCWLLWVGRGFEMMKLPL